MMKDLSVWSLKYGESVLPEHLIFKGGDSGVSLPIVFAIYLIQTESRNILGDVGCDTMPGFLMKRYYSPAFVLRKVGISADDITDVIITLLSSVRMSTVYSSANFSTFSESI